MSYADYTRNRPDEDGLEYEDEEDDTPTDGVHDGEAHGSPTEALENGSAPEPPGPPDAPPVAPVCADEALYASPKEGMGRAITLEMRERFERINSGDLSVPTQQPGESDEAYLERLATLRRNEK